MFSEERREGGTKRDGKKKTFPPMRYVRLVFPALKLIKKYMHYRASSSLQLNETYNDITNALALNGNKS